MDPMQWLEHLNDLRPSGLPEGFTDIGATAMIARALRHAGQVFWRELDGDAWGDEAMRVGETLDRIVLVREQITASLAPFGFRPLFEKRPWVRGERLAITFVGPHGGVTMSGTPKHGGRCYVLVDDPEILDKVSEALEPHFVEVPPPPPEPLHKRGVIHMLIRDSYGNIRLNRVGVAGVDFERDNYEEKVLADYDHVLGDFDVNSPCGRLALFHGVPGSGKTYLIRSMLKLCKSAGFIIVPSTMVEALGDPAIVPALADGAYDMPNHRMIFLIEDADEALVPRDQAIAQHRSNVKALSSLLNTSDGIIGSMFDIRIVCTTNALLGDIDPAVVRDGRLCRQVHVGPLSAAKANQVFFRLLPNFQQAAGTHPFTEPAALATVYRRARDLGWAPAIPKTAGLLRDRNGQEVSFDEQTYQGHEIDPGNPAGEQPPGRDWTKRRAPQKLPFDPVRTKETDSDKVFPLTTDGVLPYQNLLSQVAERLAGPGGEILDVPPSASRVTASAPVAVVTLFGAARRIAGNEPDPVRAVYRLAETAIQVAASAVVMDFGPGWDRPTLRRVLGSLGARMRVAGNMMVAVIPGAARPLGRRAAGPQHNMIPHDESEWTLEDNTREPNARTPGRIWNRPTTYEQDVLHREVDLVPGSGPTRSTGGRDDLPGAKVPPTVDRTEEDQRPDQFPGPDTGRPPKTRFEVGGDPAEHVPARNPGAGPGGEFRDDSKPGGPRARQPPNFLRDVPDGMGP